MSHQWGFLNGYAAAPPPQLNSSYGYDPGLEIWRPIDGDRWLLEAKGTFYLPCANGRQLNLFVYFGTGGTGTTAAGWTRGGDIPTCSGESYVAATEVYQPGATAGDLAYDGAGETIIGPSLATIWHLSREGRWDADLVAELRRLGVG